MKIPKTIKIFGLVWEIVHDANVAHQGGCFGATHNITEKIFLDPKNSQQRNEETLIHELLHAIWFASGLNSRYDKDKGVIEEEIIEALSTGLYQVLNDNNLLQK